MRINYYLKFVGRLDRLANGDEFHYEFKYGVFRLRSGKRVDGLFEYLTIFESILSYKIYLPYSRIMRIIEQRCDTSVPRVQVYLAELFLKFLNLLFEGRNI